MLNGLYSCATALDVLSQQQEAIAANLAHLNTPGHRRMLFSIKPASSTDNGSHPQAGATVHVKAADFTAGRLQQTGRELDFALHGDAFFVYQGAAGPMYSRSGVVFREPATGRLVNADGYPLLDDNNNPLVFEGDLASLSVSSDGVLWDGAQRIGKIGVVRFDDNRLLESENQIYFRAGKAVVQPATDFTVVQGVREMSNASPITELIALISGSRSFEASQRAIRMIAEALQEQTRS